MIRTDAQLSVSRFAELIGVPRRTYHYRLARYRAGDPAGVWTTPVVDRIEPTVVKYAEAWPAWVTAKCGHPLALMATTSDPKHRWPERYDAAACCNR